MIKFEKKNEDKKWEKTEYGNLIEHDHVAHKFEFIFKSKKHVYFSICFFQIDPFQDVSFQIVSFSGGVFFRLYPFQALSCYTISFSTFVFADHILFRNNWRCTFFSVQTWHHLWDNWHKKKKTYETSWHKNLWDTCRNCISTSVLNCSFLTPFHTMSGHLMGHLIFQHKTQKH